MKKKKKHASKRSRRRQRAKSRPWLELGLQRLTEARDAAVGRVAKLDAKIKRQEARILESTD